MAEHVWSVLCYRASIDQVTNNVSLLHVIEQLRFDATEEELVGELEAGQVRGIPAEMDLVSLWARSDYAVPERGQSRTRLVTPAGDTGTGENVYPLDLTTDFNFRVRMRIPAVPFVGFGVYRFVIEIKEDDGWMVRACVPLLIRQRRPESSNMAGAPAVEQTPPKAGE